MRPPAAEAARDSESLMRIAPVQGLVLAIVLSSGSMTSHAASDPGAVVGPERCGECHKLEVAAWKASGHASGFFSMHRSAEARRIAERLGVTRIKRDSARGACHYTQQLPKDAPKAAASPIAGVSCESCHGAARDWLELHADYGGPQATAESETEEHARTRRARSLEAGLNPSYAPERLARSCFGCHVVLDERLVDTGGHPAASGFDLVSGTQGEVRHNYFFTADKTNREASREHRRLLWVLGELLRLEHGLLGLERARQDAGFARAMRAEAQAALGSLEAAAGKAELPEVRELLEAVAAAKLGLKPREPGLKALHEQAARVARAFAARHQKSDLSGLDALLPKPESYRGKALP